MKVSTIVLSTGRSESGVRDRVHPKAPLSMNSIAPGCVTSRFVTNASNRQVMRVVVSVISKEQYSHFSVTIMKQFPDLDCMNEHQYQLELVQGR